MSRQFDFDEKKSAQENISAFLSYVESFEPVFGALLRKHMNKMLPLPESGIRSSARASFNSEIKKLLDQAVVESAK
jgi:hypothetical protein